MGQAALQRGSTALPCARPPRTADGSTPPGDEPLPAVALPRDPLRDFAIPLAARSVESLLIAQYCHSPTSYACWASDEKASASTGLSRRQLEYGMKSLAERGRILRFRSLKRFEHWLEMEGTPNYGVIRPERMLARGRVIVFVRRLPPLRRSPDAYGPLGFTEAESPPFTPNIVESESTGVWNSNPQDCGIPSYMNVRKGTEEANEPRSSQPPEQNPEPTKLPPVPSHATLQQSLAFRAKSDRELRDEAVAAAWDSLDESSRESFLEQAKAQLGSLGDKSAMVKRTAHGLFEASRPEQFPPIADDGTVHYSGMTGPAPGLTRVQLAAKTVADVKAHPTPDRRKRAAESILAALGDDRSWLGSHYGVIDDVLADVLTVRQVGSALINSTAEGIRCPGAVFRSELSKARKTARGPIRQDNTHGQFTALTLRPSNQEHRNASD